MRSLLVRLAATAVIVVVAGLPVLGVLCARECTSVESVPTQTDATGHCHEPETPGLSVRASGPGGCERPLAFTVVAARDRSAASVTDLATLTPVHVPEVEARVRLAFRFHAGLRDPHRLPPASRTPLRI